jgi:hypothetical protein
MTAFSSITLALRLRLPLTRVVSTLRVSSDPRRINFRLNFPNPAFCSLLEEETAGLE